MNLSVYSRRRLLYVGVLACLGWLLGGSQSANAGTVAYLKVDGGNWTALTLGAGGTFTSGDISGSITLTPVQFPNSAFFLSANTSLNNSGTTSHALSFVFGASGFNAPTAPPSINVKTTVAPSILSDVTSLSNAVQTFVLNGDQTGASGISPFTPNILTQPNQVTPMSQGLGVAPTGTTQIGTIASLSTGFTVGQELQMTIGANGAANLTISTTLAPEPTSMSLLGVGLVGMAGYGLRRWRRKANA
jgi:hypothetical protein